MTVIKSSEVKIIRNLKDMIFPSSNNPANLEELTDFLMENSYVKSEYSEINDLYLYENGVVDENYLTDDNATLYQKRGCADIILNLNDHITIKKSLRGLNLNAAYNKCLEAEDMIAKKFNFAFDMRFGYLTKDPLNSGTAMYPSVTMHLPALKYFGLGEIKNSLDRLKFRLDSCTFLDSDRDGSIYTLRFLTSIGDSEKNYLKRINSITKEIVQRENAARKKLYLDNIINLQDMVNRSYAILRHSRILPEDEMMEAMYNIKLGMELSVIKPSKEFKFYKELLNMRNGHLQRQRNAKIDNKTLDILRSNKSRALMKEVFI